MSKDSQSRPEMVQLDHGDYVFDEHGRGTPASTFFKRLTNYNKAAVAAATASPNQADHKVIGAAYSHADILKKKKSANNTPSPTSEHKRKTSYFESHGGGSGGSNNAELEVIGDDEDDDDVWDANVEHNTVTKKKVEKSIENPAVLNKRASKELYQQRKPSYGMKSQVDGILKDPSSSLYSVHDSISQATLASSESLPQPEEDKANAVIEEINSRMSRITKFKRVLQATNVDLTELKRLAWSGIPEELRPMSWQLLLGYLPTNADRRVSTLARKRKEYLDGVEQVFGAGNLDQQMWHQISIDVPRTNPHIKLYSYDAIQRALERVLYLWAIRHPASGYVQGINDLVTPFFQSFLSAYIDEDPEIYDPTNLPKEVMDVVEADSFWCLTKLLDGIQDNYIHAQPGIQRQVAELRDLTSRIDSQLVKHLQYENVEFMQFSFRWMNCLLMREVSVKNTIRMWDTYLAEGANGFSHFHVYVCAAFLVKWSAKLLKMDFQEIMMFLQALPTKEWNEKDIELLLSEAFMWQSLFKNALAHLRSG